MAAKKTPSHSKSKSKIAAAGARRVGLRLLGKVAVVTGGSRGIGYAIARALAAEGCSVVITGRDESSLAESAARIKNSLPESLSSAKRRTQIVALTCDVRDRESVASLFAAVKRRFGKIDVLVNNAGIAQPLVSIEQTSVELW